MEIYRILIRDVGASFIFVVVHFATDLSLKTRHRIRDHVRCCSEGGLRWTCDTGRAHGHMELEIRRGHTTASCVSQCHNILTNA